MKKGLIELCTKNIYIKSLMCLTVTKPYIMHATNLINRFMQYPKGYALFSNKTYFHTHATHE